MAAIDWVVRLQRWPIGVVGEFLGTRRQENAQARAARRWLRRLLMVHAEQLALTMVLLDKGVIGKAEYAAALQRAAETLCQELEETFPGLSATDVGVVLDVAKARETMQTWPL